tara:strand:+ start:97 stop:411 length:315 start_codon:yes stop_codon:yes gene_type:complete
MKLKKSALKKMIAEELSFEDMNQKEGKMARRELFKISKYSPKIHDMIEDDTDLPEWIEAKITKAADYLGAVMHYLEYELNSPDPHAKVDYKDQEPPQTIEDLKT